MQEGSGVPNLQTELNYLDSFKSYCNSSDLGFLHSRVGQVGGGCLGWSIIVYMTSGMFRGKESSNRIELSRLVQELLNLGVLGSLQLWGGGRWVGVWEYLGEWGIPTCMHMYEHAITCTHTHVYMYRNCKWLPTWKHPCLSCLSFLTCMCMHVYIAHSTHTLITTPTPIHPSATPTGGPLGGWVHQWVNGWGQVEWLKI